MPPPFACWPRTANPPPASAPARQRAIRDNEDAEAIILSINAKLEKMRQRRLAALPPPAQAASVAETSGSASDE